MQKRIKLVVLFVFLGSICVDLLAQTGLTKKEQLAFDKREKQLKKQVMAIETDSTPLEEPKNPDTCKVFAIYSLLANETQVAEMRAKYLGGNYGYGHAKTELLNLILENFKTEREKFNYYMNNLSELDAKLQEGAEKTRKIAAETLKRVRASLGM